MSVGINTTSDDYRSYDPALERTISFRKASMERDLQRLHAWFNAEHVLPYWQLNESLPAVRDALEEKLEDAHLQPYIGSLEHVPMSYWECYWADADGLADHCDTRPTDQGIHLLIGPEEYLGEGYAIPLVRAVTEMQFSHPETDRILTEPDVRNDTVIHVFERCGFEPRRELELPDKDALLMVCEREQFQTAYAERCGVSTDD